YYGEYKDNKEFIIQNNIDIILDEAIRKNEFDVYYQPIYNTKTKTFTACEALVRLISNKYGYIGPEHFIKYAEMSGKIFEIDSFVIKDTIKFISTDTFKSLGIDKININLSISECMDLKLYDYVTNLIKQYNINPTYLNFEITEGKDITNHKQIYEVIKKFKDIGIEFSLDDYGIGYSNIERFSNIPISTVKLDKTLVNNSKNEGMESVLSNTLNMIKSLGRKVVVEGIETNESLNEFLEYDCDFIQGFIYSKPVPKEEFIDFIKKSK
ncbi:MAG: EAL domain-containing protein, partial [Acholeplasmatales bacterium]|nr:EAL domain-containing protein [Acholeplasmatales bacterium]